MGGRALARHPAVAPGRVAPIIWARLDLAKRLGCDGVEPDQNNPMGQRPGFPITYADEKAWYLEVAAQAHARGLSVGMKNGIEIIDRGARAGVRLGPERGVLRVRRVRPLEQFIRAGKAVFQVEYRGDPDEFCPRRYGRGFSTLKKKLKLDAWRLAC